MNVFKYNIMVFCLVAIICLMVLFNGNNSALSDSEVTQAISVEVDQTPQTSAPEKDVPVFLNAWDCFNYAYDLYQNGKGFQSKCTSSVVNSAGFDQTIYIDKYKNSAGECLATTTSCGAANFYESVYRNGNVIKTAKYDGSVSYPNVPQDLSFKNDSFDSYYAANKAVPCEFSCPISKSTSKMSGFVRKKDRSGNSLYSFKIILNSSAWERYAKVIKSTTSIISEIPNIKSIIIEAVVDAKTGSFVSLITNESYTIKAFGLSIDCQATTTEIFSKMNIDVDINSVSVFK